MRNVIGQAGSFLMVTRLETHWIGIPCTPIGPLSFILKNSSFFSKLSDFCRIR